jgi:transcription elongation factor SPT4
MGSSSREPAQIPTSFGHELRACLRCRLIKTYDQFRESGCENCPFFKMDEDHERVVDCTTPNFNGFAFAFAFAFFSSYKMIIIYSN